MANRMIDAATLDGIVAAPWQGFDNGSPSCSHGFELLLEAWTGGHGELEPAAVSLGS